MSITQIKGNQILDGTITSTDIDDSLEKDFTKVRVTTGDSSPNFLSSKIVAGDNITIAVVGVSGSAQYLAISGSAGGSGDITSVIAGTGLTGGATSGDATLSINDSIVATVSGTQFTGPISSTAFTSSDRVLIVSGTSREISQANALNWDSTNQFLGIGVTPSRALHVSTGFRVGSTNYIEYVQGNSATFRAVTGGTITTIEHNPRLIVPSNVGNFIGFQLQNGSDPDVGFSRASAGILNVSGSAPGALLRFNASSTPLAAGDLGMNITTGRPQAYIGGSAVSLAHTGEIPPINSAYVTIGNDATLTGERALTAGTGLLLTDGGAGSTATLAINNSSVATVSGTQFTGPISSTGFSLPDRVLITSGSSKTISQANALVYESTNQYLGIGVANPGRNINVITGIRWGNSPDYLELVGAGGGILRWVRAGAITTVEYTPQLRMLANRGNLLGWSSSETVTPDVGFSRAATGILNVSGSAPGAVLRFNASSTPLAAGDLGMSTVTGRPQVFVGGGVVALAHTGEVALLAGGNTFTGAQTQSTGNVSLAGASGDTFTVGHASTTGTAITLGQSTASNTINIGNATTATGNTQTVNIATSATGTGKATIAIGNNNGATGVTISGGSVGISLTAAGPAAIGTTNGAFQLTTGTGTISIGTDATSKSVTIGSTSGTTSVTLNAGSGGVSVGANFALTQGKLHNLGQATVTQQTNPTNSVTINSASGVITTVAMTTAVGATGTVFTVNNSAVSSTSSVVLSIGDYSGTYYTNGCPYAVVDSISSGAFNVRVLNVAQSGQGALNGTLKIKFMVG